MELGIGIAGGVGHVPLDMAMKFDLTLSIAFSVSIISLFHPVRMTPRL